MEPPLLRLGVLRRRRLMWAVETNPKQRPFRYRTRSGRAPGSGPAISAGSRGVSETIPARCGGSGNSATAAEPASSISNIKKAAAADRLGTIIRAHHRAKTITASRGQVQNVCRPLPRDFGESGHRAAERGVAVRSPAAWRHDRR